MTSLARRSVIALAASIALAAPLAGAAPASAETKLKMVLNWKYQGPQGAFLAWFLRMPERHLRAVQLVRC